MRSLARRLDPVFRRSGVRFAYLWGSRARGCARPDSDYDIAVSLPKGRRAFDRYLDLSAALSEALVRFACLARKIYWDERPRLEVHARGLMRRLQDGTFGA